MEAEVIDGRGYSGYTHTTQTPVHVKSFTKASRLLGVKVEEISGLPLPLHSSHPRKLSRETPSPISPSTKIEFIGTADAPALTSIDPSALTEPSLSRAISLPLSRSKTVRLSSTYGETSIHRRSPSEQSPPGHTHRRDPAAHFSPSSPYQGKGRGLSSPSAIRFHRLSSSPRTDKSPSLGGKSPSRLSGGSPSSPGTSLLHRSLASVSSVDSIWEDKSESKLTESKLLSPSRLSLKVEDGLGPNYCKNTGCKRFKVKMIEKGPNLYCPGCKTVHGPDGGKEIGKRRGSICTVQVTEIWNILTRGRSDCDRIYPDDWIGQLFVAFRGELERKEVEERYIDFVSEWGIASEMSSLTKTEMQQLLIRIFDRYFEKYKVAPGDRMRFEHFYAVLQQSHGSKVFLIKKKLNSMFNRLAQCGGHSDNSISRDDCFIILSHFLTGKIKDTTSIIYFFNIQSKLNFLFNVLR